MFKKELRKNKIVALLLVGLGIIPVLIEKDATLLLVSSIAGIGLFFAKENYID